MNPVQVFRRSRGPRLLLLLALLTALLVTLVCVVVLSARRSLQRAIQTVAGEGQLPFTLRVLDPSLAQRLGAELISSRADYSQGAFFEGEWYLAGRSGLTVVRPDGTTQRSLRYGVELPAAPITAIAAARLRGASEPQLLLATGGAGMLLLGMDPHTPLGTDPHRSGSCSGAGLLRSAAPAGRSACRQIFR